MSNSHISAAPHLQPRRVSNWSDTDSLIWIWLFRQPRSDRDVLAVAERGGAWMWHCSSCDIYMLLGRDGLWSAVHYEINTLTRHQGDKWQDKTQAEKTETPYMISGGSGTREERIGEKREIGRRGMDSWRDKGKGFREDERLLRKGSKKLQNMMTERESFNSMRCALL